MADPVEEKKGEKGTEAGGKGTETKPTASDVAASAAAAAASAASATAEGAKPKPDTSSASPTQAEIELRNAKTELAASQKREQEAKDKLDTKEKADLAAAGKFQELYEREKTERVTEKRKSDARFAKVAIRSKVESALAQVIDSALCSVVADSVSVDGVKVGEDGTITGVEVALKAHREANPKLYEKLGLDAEAKGENKGGEDKGGKGGEGKGTTAERASFAARTGIQVGEGTGSPAGNPPRGEATPFNVKELDAAQYRKFKTDYVGNLKKARARAGRTG